MFSEDLTQTMVNLALKGLPKIGQLVNKTSNRTVYFNKFKNIMNPQRMSLGNQR